MVFEAAFTHVNGQKYVELYHKNPTTREIVPDLQLEGIARGNDTFIWKPVSDGWYAMICKKRTADSNDLRQFSVVYALVMDREESVSLKNDWQKFLKVKSTMEKLPYHKICALTERDRDYPSIDMYLKNTVFETRWLSTAPKKPVNDNETKTTLFKCMLAAVYRNQIINIEKPIKLESLLDVLNHVPECISDRISFSFLYGGTPAGECMINFIDQNFIPDNSISDGAPVADYVNEENICDETVLYAAEEINYFYDNYDYMEMIRQRDISSLVRILSKISFLRWVNENAINGMDSKELSELISKNHIKWKSYQKISPFIKYEGKLSKKLENIIRSSVERPEQKKRSKSRSSSSGVIVMGEILVILVSAFLSGLIHVYGYRISDVRTIRLVLTMNPEDLCTFLLLAVLLLTLCHLISIIERRLIDAFHRNRKRTDHYPSPENRSHWV